MIALFAGGGISGHLTKLNGRGPLTIEPVLVVGFDVTEGESLGALCIAADGETEMRRDFMSLYLDWRYVGDEWLTLAEIDERAGKEEPDAGGEDDGSTD